MHERKAGKMRYKGRYVAQIGIDFEFEYKEGMLPLEEIKYQVLGGGMTKEIENLLSDEVNDLSTVTVTQKYADLQVVEDERTD